MPTPRLPDNSDAFGSLISVKPNTSTVHTVSYLWHLFTLQMVGQLHIIRPKHKHKMVTYIHVWSQAEENQGRLAF